MRKIFLCLVISLLFIPFQNQGQTWSSLTRLTWNAGSSVGPSIVADACSGLHLVWMDDTLGDLEIFYKHSSDSGASWSGPSQLTWNAGDSYSPSIAANRGGGVHVIWHDLTPGNSEIFYKRSTDSGNSWSESTRMTWNPGWSGHPSITADTGSGIHMVWGDETPGNLEIFYKHSSDSGASWSGSTRITWNPGWSGHPSVAADTDGGIHVVWSDETPGLDNEIFYKRSTDSGATWSGPTRFTWNVRESFDPAITIDPSNGIHVVWCDYYYSDDTWISLFYNRSTDGGATWSGSTRLTWKIRFTYAPSIVADRNNGIHLVWDDESQGLNEIYYKRSVDAGASWQALTRLTWTPGISDSPSITADLSGGIHVVWSDSASSNFEIFYTQGTYFNIY